MGGLVGGRPGGPQGAFILVSGWVCSFRSLPDGTRQIVDFQLPGDFVGLRNILFSSAGHGCEAVTDATLSAISAADLFAAFGPAPRLATAVLWAHSLLELGTRLRLVGLASQDGFVCPLTQYQLADALGLSAIHLNRVLRRLREGGLLTFRNGHVRFDDLGGLVALAGFDMDYLMESGPPLRRRIPAGRP